MYARVGSTSDVVRALAAAGAPAGTTALAEQQSAGRGQHGRHWEDRPGASLLLSVLLRPASAAAPGAAPLRVGLAVATAIDRLTGLHTRLKWPNDLLLQERKAGGVLCEAATTGGATSIVAGIGINVGQAATDFSRDVAPRATSLRMAGAGDVSRAALAGAILDELLAGNDRIAEPLDAEELQAFAGRDALRGQVVAIDDVVAGTAVGVSALGELRVQNDGRIVTVHTGRVRIAGARAVAHERAP